MVLALYHKANGTLNDAALETMGICYGFLADFVSDDVAEKSRRFYEVTQGSEALKRLQEDPIGLAREISKGEFPGEEMKSSNQEFAHLCDEFKDRLDALDDPARKSQEFAVIRKVLLGE